MRILFGKGQSTLARAPVMCRSENETGFTEGGERRCNCGGPLVFELATARFPFIARIVFSGRVRLAEFTVLWKRLMMWTRPQKRLGLTTTLSQRNASTHDRCSK